MMQLTSDFYQRHIYLLSYSSSVWSLLEKLETLLPLVLPEASAVHKLQYSVWSYWPLQCIAMYNVHFNIILNSDWEMYQLKLSSLFYGNILLSVLTVDNLTIVGGLVRIWSDGGDDGVMLGENDNIMKSSQDM